MSNLFNYIYNYIPVSKNQCNILCGIKYGKFIGKYTHMNYLTEGFIYIFYDDVTNIYMAYDHDLEYNHVTFTHIIKGNIEIFLPFEQISIKSMDKTYLMVNIPFYEKDKLYNIKITRYDIQNNIITTETIINTITGHCYVNRY